MEHNGERYVGFTFHEGRERMLTIAESLRRGGIKRGERIAIIAENSSTWLLTELATFYIGAIVVPITIANDDKTILSQIEHSEPSLIVISEQQAMRFCASQLFNNGYRTISIKDIETLSKEKTSTEVINDILDNTRNFKDDDTCLICYTSGTTSNPKGVMMTYNNFLNHMLCYSTLERLYRNHKVQESALVLLPMSHIFVIITLLSYTNMGCTSYFIQQGNTVAETLMNMKSNLLESHPIVMSITPSILQKYKYNIDKAISKQSKTKQRLFRLSQSITLNYKEHSRNGKFRWGYILKPLVTLSDKIFFSRIKREFGGKIKLLMSGGSALSLKTSRFFESINIEMINCWGMTENIGGNFFTNCDNYRLGSVGRGNWIGEVKVTDADMNVMPPFHQGEILYKGPLLMKGYWKNPEATKEAITEDGWLRTGDMGYKDKDGFLFINGRAKSMLVNASSEKYCSEEMENAIVSDSPYIMQAMLFNEGNEHTSAIIVPDQEYIRKKDIETLIKVSLTKIKEENNFPTKWFPIDFIMAHEPFSIANKQLNASMKMVRRNILAAYRKEIDALKK